VVKEVGAVNFDHRHYVPCIRWKMGEYQAIFNLSSKATWKITPLIEAPEIGFDFEKWKPVKSVDDHLAPFAKRVKTQWQGRHCFVDMKLIEPSKRMVDGQHPAEFVFNELRSQDCMAIPVSGLDRDQQYQEAIRRAVVKDSRGLCLRLGIEDAFKTTLKREVDVLLSHIGLQVRECDLVLDLGAPNFEPVNGFAKLIEDAIIRRLPDLRLWRTFTLVGTSFPQSMAEVKESPATIRRSEWLLYTMLIENLRKTKTRLPAFGDYGINHPSVDLVDWRKVKPSAKIKYTADDSWFIVKGSNVRDNKFEQYRGLCQTVIDSPHYPGEDFSYGDKYIADCASGIGKTGNLTTWCMVGMNHHLEKVVADIASFFGSSGTP